MEGIDLFVVLKYFYPYLELDPFLVETHLVIFYLFYFLESVFSGVTLALVSTVNPELTDRSVRSLSATITSGADSYDVLIKFGQFLPFVSWYIL